MMYDYFVAARFRNRGNALALTQAIRKQGYSVYCFAESPTSQLHVGSLADDPETAMQQFEARPHNDPGMREVFETDLAAERASSTFILLLPAGMSCHVEAGVAFGLGKRLILIGEPEKSESLYGIFTERYVSQQQFLKSLPTKNNR